MPVEFKKQEFTVEYVTPQGERQSYTLEVRTDPLTGDMGTVFRSPSPFASRRYPADLQAVPVLVQRSVELGCPFCHGALEKTATRFTPEFWPQGLMAKGKARVFPNRDLFHTPYSAILILGLEHYVEPKGFTPDLLASGLEAAQLYFQRAAHHSPPAPFQTVNWNYFPPAGGSIIHPHLQLQGGPFPTNRHRRLLEDSRSYQQRHGANFWPDLIAAEKARGERYIGHRGPVCWLSPFVPRGRMWDVIGVVEGGSGLAEFSSQQIEGLAEGIARVLTFIQDQGQYSFNLSLLSAVEGEDSLWSVCHILPRTITPPMGMSDCSYLDTLLDHPSTSLFPEDICRDLRQYFR